MSQDRHASRLNHRAPRGRDGRSRRDRRRASRAEHAMDVWAEWVSNRQEYGWPRESSEVRAYHQAQTKTVTDGIAQYRGRVEVGDGDKTVAKEPPPMPKETRAAAKSRVPNLEAARFGPQVNRHLLDMDETGLFRAASVLRAAWLHPKEPTTALADGLGVSPRTFFRLKRQALAHLETVLSLQPRR